MNGTPVSGQNEGERVGGRGARGRGRQGVSCEPHAKRTVSVIPSRDAREFGTTCAPSNVQGVVLRPEETVGDVCPMLEDMEAVPVSAPAKDLDVRH